MASAQDEKDYQEAMKAMKPAPKAPAAPAESAYDKKLRELDEGKKSKPSGYFNWGNIPSKGVKGMVNQVKGDIGAARQEEMVKVFGAQGGKNTNNPLKYSAPDTAIDAKFGPGDKVC